MRASIELIAAERERQITEEGYDEQRDLEYRRDQLARAAAVYALPEQYRLYRGGSKVRSDNEAPDSWPWANDTWKPTPDDRIRELVKAGALIVAELDRLLYCQKTRPV